MGFLVLNCNFSLFFVADILGNVFQKSQRLLYTENNAFLFVFLYTHIKLSQRRGIRTPAKDYFVLWSKNTIIHV